MAMRPIFMILGQSLKGQSLKLKNFGESGEDDNFNLSEFYRNRNWVKQRR